MSSDSRHDVAVAFAIVHDELRARRPVTTELEAWAHDRNFGAAQAGVIAAVDASATIDASQVAALRGGASARLFAALTGLDLVLSAANSDTPSSDPVTALLQSRRRRQGAYLASAEDGAVLAKRVDQRQVQVGSETLADALGVLRVAPDTWRLVHHMVVPRSEDHSHSPGDLLQVAAVPLGADSDDLTMESTTTQHGRHIYIATPTSSLAGRVPSAASGLHGVDLGLAPELTLDSDGLTAWRQSSEPFSSPTWVFAGTGPLLEVFEGASAPATAITSASGAPLRPNRGVLLHGPTGRVIAVQDKRAGFTITPSLLEDYGLPTVPAVSHDEGMEPGSALTIIESRAGRFAIYICEDLGREIELAHQLAEIGVTHLIVPVLATPMMDYRWQHLSSSRMAQFAGVTTMVINSLTLGRFDKDGNPAKTLLLVEPENGSYNGAVQWVFNGTAATMTAAQDAVAPRRVTTRSR